MDAYIKQYFPGNYYDENASIATSGVIHQQLLAALKDHSFFSKSFPKTTGPELFNLQYLENASHCAGVKLDNHSNVMATLNRFTADTIASAVKEITDRVDTVTIYTSGGGMHNPLLMKNLQQQLPQFIFDTTGVLHLNPDAKEAVLFAVLANESIAGGDIKIPGNPFVSMGKISFPH